jgi:hypothetical protein
MVSPDTFKVKSQEREIGWRSQIIKTSIKKRIKFSRKTNNNCGNSRKLKMEKLNFISSSLMIKICGGNL